MIIILYDIIIPEPSMFFSALYNVVIVTVTVFISFIMLCDIILLFLFFKKSTIYNVGYNGSLW